jgi:hypothetical protein
MRQLPAANVPQHSMPDFDSKGPFNNIGRPKQFAD